MIDEYVYISGPYTLGNKEQNVKIALAYAEVVTHFHGTPFIPHLFHFWNKQHPHDYNFWMNQCLPWVRVCDSLIRVPGESKGADIEVKCAIDNGIPVYTLQEYMQWRSR